MSFVAAGTFIVGEAAAASMGALATGMIGGALVGAGTGALVNGVTGRSVLNGALIGGAIGGLGGGLGGAAAGFGMESGAGMMAADASSQIAAGIPASQVSATLQTTYGLTAAQAEAITASAASSAGTTASTAASLAPTAANAANTPQPPVSAGNSQYVPPVSNPQSVPTDYNPSTPGFIGPYGTPDVAAADAAAKAAQPSGISTYANKALNWMGNNKALTAAGLGAAYLATRPNAFQANYLPQYNPPTAQSYGLNSRLASNYRPTFAAAQGGIASLDKNFAAGDMYPMSQIDHTQYASSPQTPVSMQATMASYDPMTNPLTGEPTTHMASGGIADAPVTQPVQPLAGGLTAAGITGLQQSPAQQQKQGQPLTTDYIKSLASQYGVDTAGIDLSPSNAIPKYVHGGDVRSNLGGYSDGGRLLKGPGDGMSDNIPASIAGKQPARLADGEFVVPADVVSHLGNGSTDAGAKHLYKMMDNVRKARTGRKAQGKQIKADKFLPK